jgi:hypothetical protein
VSRVARRSRKSEFGFIVLWSLQSFMRRGHQAVR